MATYKSKHTGERVDNAVTKIPENLPTEDSFIVVKADGSASEYIPQSQVLSDKLDKQTAQTTSDQIYGKLADGSQTMFDVTMGAEPTTIPRRDTAGRIQVADGVSGNDAVNFKQLSIVESSVSGLNIKNGTGLYSLVQRYIKNDIDHSPIATGIGSVAFGGLRFDYDPTKHSGDTTNTAAGNQSFVAGCGNYTAGDWSFVSGKDNTVYSNRAFVSGGANVSQAINSEGNLLEEKTNVGRFNAIFGNNNVFKSSGLARESNLIAGGSNTVDTERSIVVGYNNNVTGSFDAIFGFTNVISADYSLTGGRNHVVSGGSHLVAGSGNEVSGQYNIASGRDNQNLGWNSAVIGRELIVGKNHTSQTVLGQYNDNKSDTVLEIGWGNPDNRKNVFEVLQDGRAKVQTAPVDIDDVVRKLELDRKFDKAGGTIGGNVVITGDLTVNGTQHINNTENLNVENAMIYSNANGATLATNGGIGIKKNATDVYGIVYDPTSDSVKLGIGKSDANGRFTFNANEGQPVAIRDDSSKFTNNNLVKWDGESYKFVDAGKNVDSFVDKLPASLRNQAYVRNANGEDSGLAYTYTDEGNSLALRNASGQLQVSTPLQDNDAANKKFVEDEIAVEVETSLMGA